MKNYAFQQFNHSRGHWNLAHFATCSHALLSTTTGYITTYSKFTADITKNTFKRQLTIHVLGKCRETSFYAGEHLCVANWDSTTRDRCKPDISRGKYWHYARGNRAAIFSRVDLGRSGNWMSNSTIMSPRRLGSFEYGRPSPAIRRTVVGFIMSGILSVAVRLLSVGTLIVTPPSIACTKSYAHNSQHTVLHHSPQNFWVCV